MSKSVTMFCQSLLRNLHFEPMCYKYLKIVGDLAVAVSFEDSRICESFNHTV